MVKKTNLKLCPFHNCLTCSCYDWLLISEDDWNTRPIEDALKARIAELEEKQRWRVVANGKLPKIGIPVLFLADWGSIYEGCTYDGKTIALYVLEDYEDSDITHWMPRPVLPEVQE